MQHGLAEMSTACTRVSDHGVQQGSTGRNLGARLFETTRWRSEIGPKPVTKGCQIQGLRADIYPECQCQSEVYKPGIPRCLYPCHFWFFVTLGASDGFFVIFSKPHLLCLYFPE